MRFIIFAVILSLIAGYIFNNIKAGDKTFSDVINDISSKAEEIVNKTAEGIKNIDTEELAKKANEAVNEISNTAKNIIEAVKNKDFSNINIPNINLSCASAKAVANNIKNNNNDNSELGKLIKELKSSGLNDSDIDMYIEEIFCKEKN